MKTADILKAFADDLERENNEAILLSEENDEEILVVATALVEAAAILRKAAEAVEKFEPEPGTFTPEQLEEMAAVAQAFDESDDELLQKQANVLDMILQTIAAKPGEKSKYVEAETSRIESLKKKYEEVGKTSQEHAMASEGVEAIKKSDYMKEYRPMEAPLQTRYCPDHAGVPTSRIEEHQYQCSIDGKVFDYENGFKTDKGDSVPGSSVSNQSQNLHGEQQNQFDTRESRLGNYYSK